MEASAARSASRDAYVDESVPAACCSSSPLAVQLAPSVQHYEWGMPAASSLVATFAAVSKRGEQAAASGHAWDALLSDSGVAQGLRRRGSDSALPLQGDRRPFAELWMGAHASGTNRVTCCFNDPKVLQRREDLAARSYAQSHPEVEASEAPASSGSEAENTRRGVKRKGSGDLRSVCLRRWLSRDQGGASPTLSRRDRSEFPLTRRRSLSEAFVGCPLPIFISANPEFMGGQNMLPMLFKVLSVQKPLSIQSHPDKQLAEILHRQHPNHFPDSNHKPELAIAVGPFEALCGFRAVEEVVLFIQHTPELKEAVGGDVFLRDSGGALQLLSNWRKTNMRQWGAAVHASGGSHHAQLSHQRSELLKALFSTIMRLPKETVAAALTAMAARLSTSVEPTFGASDLSERERDSLRIANTVAVRLYQAHGLDVGVFAAFYLNYVRLNSGEGVFIGPNIPHCYLSGHCLECMANSDNVIRGGLTPKHTDIDLLCSTLRFDLQATVHRVAPEPVPGLNVEASWQGRVAVYDPHVQGLSDFRVYKLSFADSQRLDDGGRILRTAPGLALVLHAPFAANLNIQRGPENAALPLHFGQVLFLSAGASLALETAGGEDDGNANVELLPPAPGAHGAVEAQGGSQIAQLLAEDEKAQFVVFLVTFGSHTQDEGLSGL
ncbi:hypothetical protein BESB_003320 [Besnoitia besnoiti]|uniref:mannose-6-phosphate isomerase n=1 Tax=Besnoitia besnoiti TaxID=94643 RepID=A0A2A9MNA1_BESBE|nr:hypothetical protein BESB_003320 [Besnoitia besnoiti]PFH37991.1 hypothetical protein BESB_003320 [Besnoitia besnoiti]